MRRWLQRPGNVVPIQRSMDWNPFIIANEVAEGTGLTVPLGTPDELQHDTTPTTSKECSNRRRNRSTKEKSNTAGVLSS